MQRICWQIIILPGWKWLSSCHDWHGFLFEKCGQKQTRQSIIYYFTCPTNHIYKIKKTMKIYLFFSILAVSDSVVFFNKVFFVKSSGISSSVVMKRSWSGKVVLREQISICIHILFGTFFPWAVLQILRPHQVTFQMSFTSVPIAT